MKKTITLFMFLSGPFLLASCSENSEKKDYPESKIDTTSSILLKSNDNAANDLVGHTFFMDGLHSIEFKTISTYFICQRPANCGGDGKWSIANGKIILGPNDSNCESTRAKQGTYNFNDFK